MLNDPYVCFFHLATKLFSSFFPRGVILNTPFIEHTVYVSVVGFSECETMLLACVL